MRSRRRELGTAISITFALLVVSTARATPYEARSPAARAAYTAAAVVANLVPGISAAVVPRCLPGYIVCKVFFAGTSGVTALAQLILSGGGDLAQTRALLQSGFGGDWYLTGRHVAGDVTADVYPAAPPPAVGAHRDFEAPPL